MKTRKYSQTCVVVPSCREVWHFRPPVSPEFRGSLLLSRGSSGRGLCSSPSVWGALPLAVACAALRVPVGFPRAWAQALRPACVWVGDKVPVYTPSCKLPPCPVLHPCPAKMPLPLIPWSEAVKKAVVSCGLMGFLLWPWQKHPLWESEPPALQSPELGHRKHKGPVGPGVIVSGLTPLSPQAPRPTALKLECLPQHAGRVLETAAWLHSAWTRQ